MSNLLNLLPTLVEEEQEDLPLLLKNADNPEKDKNGVCTSILRGSYEALALGALFLENDLEKYRVYMTKSICINLSLIQRFVQGEPISKSYVSITPGYQALLKALSICDFNLAEKLAALVGGRENIEKEFDHKFDIYMGYSIKYLVLGAYDKSAKYARQLEDFCKTPSNKSDQGYPILILAIIDGNQDKINDAFNFAFEGHKKLIKGSGRWKGTIHELVWVWGLGLLNFIRHKGMNIDFTNKLLPEQSKYAL